MLRDRWHPRDRTLTAFLDHELSVRRQESLARHLAACPRCAERLRRIELASQNAASLIRTGVEPDSEAALLRRRLESRLADLAALSAADGPRLDTRRALGLPFGGVAVAAAIAIAAVAGPLHRSTPVNVPESLRARQASGALPDPSLTPGAVHKTTTADLCVIGRRDDRTVSDAVRVAVLRAYGMEHVSGAEYELDYLITPELGGMPDRQNLWPERYASRIWNARVKDDLERLLARLVCAGRLDLATAQRDIAVDWIAAYKKYFHASAPLTTYADAFDDDDPVVSPSPPLVALAQLARR